MKKHQFIRTVIISIIIILLVSACISLPQTSESTTQETASPFQTIFQKPVPTATPVNIESLQPITPENVMEMDLVAELGVGNAYDAALSPDGKTIAALTVYKIILYDRTTFEEKFSIPVNVQSESAITYNPDGSELIYSDTQNIIFLNANDGSEFSSFSLGSTFDRIEELIFIPENDRLLVMGSNYKNSDEFCFILFDLEGHKLFDREYTDQNWFYLFRFIDKNKTALLIYKKDNEELIPIQTFIFNNNSGNVLASYYRIYNKYEPDEETVLGTISYLPEQSEIEQWVKDYENYPLREEILKCDRIPNHLSNPILSNDENIVLLELKGSSIMYENTNLRIEEIDLPTCQLNRYIGFSNARFNPVFSPDDRYLVNTSFLSTYVWDLTDGTIWLDYPGTLSGYPSYETAFNSDGSKLLFFQNIYDDEAPISLDNQNSIIVFDMQTRDISQILNLENMGPLIMYSTFSPDIMIFDLYNELAIWNIEANQQIVTIPHGPMALDPSRNGVWVLRTGFLCYDAAQLYDLDTGSLLGELPIYITGDDTTVNLIDEGSTLEISYYERSFFQDYIHINIDSGETIDQSINDSSYFDKYVYDFQGTYPSRWEFTYTPGRKQSVNMEIGPFIIVPSKNNCDYKNYNEFDFWAVENHDYLGEMRTHFSVAQLLISPNQHYLALLGSDGIIRIYGVKEE